MFRTPPSTIRNPYLKYKRRLDYYEDLYGKPNEEEAFDRFPDVCEDETDSEEDDEEDDPHPHDHRKDKKVESGAPASILGPQVDLRQNSLGSGRELIGQNQVRLEAAAPSIYSNAHLPYTPSSNNTTREEGSGGFRIAPSLNTRTSIATPLLTPTRKSASVIKTTPRPKPAAAEKWLKPIKYGLFAPTARKFLPEMFEENTAGEAMDDLLGSSRFEVTDDYGFGEQDLEDEDGPNSFFNGLDEDGNVVDPAITAAEDQEVDEGDVEEDLATTKKKNQADVPSQRKKRKREVEAQGPVRKSLRQAGVQKDGGCQSLRSAGKKQASQIRKKVERGKFDKRKPVRSIGSEVLEDNIIKGKPQRRSEGDRKRLVRGTREGLRLKSWKGDAIGKDEPIVEVMEDEVKDVGEFVKC